MSCSCHRSVSDQHILQAICCKTGNTMSAELQRKNGFLEIFQYVCGPFPAVPLRCLFAICIIHGLFSSFATTLVKYDGVVKTSIYCVVCPVATRGHTTCIVKTRQRTLLLGVYASLSLPVCLCFCLSIFKHCPDFLQVHQI